MAKVQAKLMDCIEKQSMKSLDRLSEALDTTSPDDNNNTDTSSNVAPMAMDAANEIMSSPGIDASETAGIRGENKVLVSRRSKRKLKHSYRMKAVERKSSSETQVQTKPRPRYYCAF